MKNETVRELVVKTVEEAVGKVGYKEGDSPTPVLEEVVKSLTGPDSIEELWGPVWVLFLVIVSNEVNLHTDDKVRNDSIKEVVGRMNGHSLITPYDMISDVTGVFADSVSMLDENDHYLLAEYVTTATRISIDVNIPSPTEVGYLYATLNGDASPTTMNYLWNKYPETYKLNHDSKTDIERMVKATVVLSQELGRSTDSVPH